jgi:Tfp pilus assembly protein PilN
MRAVNLIPAEQRGGAPVGSGRSEGAAYGVLAVLAGVAVLALLYGQARHEVSSRRGQAASLTQQAQTAQTAASRLAPYTSFIALREQRTRTVAQLVNSRFDWAHVFHEFGRVLPAEISISSLTGTVGSATTTSSRPASSGAAAAGATVSSATPPGSVPTFTVTGCATNQAAVALTLERLRLMDGVSNVTLQSSTAQPSSSGTGTTSANGCSAKDPVFTVQVAFEGLPQPSAVTPSTATASNSGGGVR